MTRLIPIIALVDQPTIDAISDSAALLHLDALRPTMEANGWTPEALAAGCLLRSVCREGAS